MDGNIFTDSLRAGLSTDVKNFLKQHKIGIYFKFELVQFFDAGYSFRPQKNRLKYTDDTRLTKLQNMLLSMCNYPVDNEFIKKANASYVCKKNKKTTFRTQHISPQSDGTKLYKTIGEGYHADQVKKVFNNFFDNTDYDLIILVSEDDEAFTTDGKKKEVHEAMGKPLHERVIGFLISQYAECRDAENKYSNIPALNLLCNPKKHKHKGNTKCANEGCVVVGRVLMYMYLYALKKKQCNYGLLELANLYCNIAGLCLYNKFGFREDVSMKTATCFPDNENLPMVSKLHDITYDQLENALIAGRNVPIDDSEPLCTIPSEAKDKDGKVVQTKLVKLQNDMVDTRMKNYDNIVALQNGEISLDDVEEIYFDNQKRPSELKEAVKTLSKYSKKGDLINLKKALRKSQKTTTPPIRQTRNRTKASQKQEALANKKQSFYFKPQQLKKAVHFFTDLSRQGVLLHKPLLYKRQSKRHTKTKKGGACHTRRNITRRFRH